MSRVDCYIIKISWVLSRQCSRFLGTHVCVHFHVGEDGKQASEQEDEIETAAARWQEGLIKSQRDRISCKSYSLKTHLRPWSKQCSPVHIPICLWKCNEVLTVLWIFLHMLCYNDEPCLFKGCIILYTWKKVAGCFNVSHLLEISILPWVLLWAITTVQKGGSRYTDLLNDTLKWILPSLHAKQYSTLHTTYSKHEVIQPVFSSSQTSTRSLFSLSISLSTVIPILPQFYCLQVPFKKNMQITIK